MKTKNKRCKNQKCLSENKALPIDHFYRRTDTPDNLQYYCKECCKKNSFNVRKRKKEILRNATGGSWWLEKSFGGRE